MEIGIESRTSVMNAFIEEVQCTAELDVILSNCVAYCIARLTDDEFQNLVTSVTEATMNHRQQGHSISPLAMLLRRLLGNVMVDENEPIPFTVVDDYDEKRGDGFGE